MPDRPDRGTHRPLPAILEERRAVSEVFSAMPVNEADSGDPLPHVRYGRTGVTHSFNPSLLSVSDAGGMTFLLLFLGHCLRR